MANEYPALRGRGLPRPTERLGQATIPFVVAASMGRIDRAGKLVARWQLPRKVTVAGMGEGFVYTVRTDEDDLRYLQRVPLPK